MGYADPILYTAIKLDGDYVWLRRLDDPTAEPIMVARALLPEEVAEGSLVQRVLFDYHLID